MLLRNSRRAGPFGLGGRICLVAALVAASVPAAARTLHAYGPGGPGPAMKEVAKAYEKKTGTKVVVTAGPATGWMAKAKANGDILFSGSENMMTEFQRKLGPLVASDTIEPLYIRPSTILVRPGNPRAIEGIRDLAKPGFKIMVVGGAGQVGMWEDVAARTGDRNLLAGFRRNIAVNAQTSGDALKRWKSDSSIDAWLIWNHWQISNAEVADAVPVEEELRIWRPMDAGLMTRAKSDREARSFLEYLTSPEGRAVFEKYGWKR